MSENEMNQTEVEVETNQDIEPIEHMSGDSMDAFIETAGKIEAYEKAMKAIMNFILRQSFAGDWVSFSKADEPVMMRSANISSAGAERIAKALGIQESNWNRKEKVWADDHSSYSYEVEADFSLGKRKVHAYGRAGSKDKFFGYAYGKWKELTDVREDDIKMAAFRSCRKEGVRTLLGLRKIPLLKLKELNFNIEMVHFVNFKSSVEAVNGRQLENKSEASSSATATPAGAEKPETNSTQVTITIAEMKPNISKKGTQYYTLTDSEGAKAYVWDKKVFDILLTAWRDQKQVTVVIESGQYPTIVAVIQ